MFVLYIHVHVYTCVCVCPMQAFQVQHLVIFKCTHCLRPLTLQPTSHLMPPTPEYRPSVPSAPSPHHAPSSPPQCPLTPATSREMSSPYPQYTLRPHPNSFRAYLRERMEEARLLRHELSPWTRLWPATCLWVWPRDLRHRVALVLTDRELTQREGPCTCPIPTSSLCTLAVPPPCPALTTGPTL